MPSVVTVASWASEVRALEEFRRAEQERIRRHLRTVEQDLRARAAGHLPEQLRAARARNLDRLHEYWVRGTFPKNLEVPERVPFLRDPFGTPCAVAYLVEESGSRALVDGLAARANHVYVDDVTGGPLLDWIDGSGLTQDECARIQPAYEPLPPSPPPVEPPLPLPDLSAVPSLAGHEAASIALLAAWSAFWVVWVLRTVGAFDRRRVRGRPLAAHGSRTG